MRIKVLLAIGFIFIGCFTVIAQNPKVHSHNDYKQPLPFYRAFAADVQSLEVDVFLVEGVLMVAHELGEVTANATLERLYLQPLKEMVERGMLADRTLQVLIDIKTDAVPTLNALMNSLRNYPMITDHEHITLVVSGNRPPLATYVDYPEFILFDYQSTVPVTNAAVMEKIAMVSLSFRQFSEWNGKGRLTAADLNKVSGVIAKAHAMNKPFRFWATPDSKTAWKAFTDLGVDVINTDMPYECVSYVRTLNNRVARNTVFSEVYTPSYSTDAIDKAPKNVILLIGDGNGLTQISSATLANGGALTLTQLKQIGFLTTRSADDFTTDSAAAGTAIATGQKTNNRAIGTDKDGNPIPNLTEILVDKGFATGVISTDGITGATPSSFYGHRTDRDMEEGLAEDLKESKLHLFIAQRSNEVKAIETSGFQMINTIEALGGSTYDKVGAWMDYSANSPLPQHVEKLATATKNGIAFLQHKNTPFFLLAEGAKIDSYGHVNDIGGVIAESISFDKAITEAIKFADKDKNTLVIITADHETGGLTIPQGNMDRHEVEADFTTHDHTATMVPIFAYGPMSHEFQGVYANNEVFHKILKVLGL
ncbi:alkaline phosphatase [Maribacter sp. MAR_2009_72]|uniref:alkaline phosphatase n=1 Tax=Maribacter sp. MAR_2009_72 TaxID=1250050 RepID=UPI001199C368|nr:alkaline phosphatase [Maribacter sp. MAR_2009_72]TVZ16932.1 alkaline phosphatase [Maribacter sp. MAR_2009_72]